jgi:hypothetical protein
MSTLNLDTDELVVNKSIILVGNSPITDIHKEILKKYEVIYISPNFNQSLDGLPGNIKAIHFSIHNNSCILQNCSCHTDMVLAFNQPLNNLHHGLEYLELDGIDILDLQNLPITLKYLVLYNITCSINILKYLPESLEVLYLDSIIINYEDLSNLPRGLTELYLHGGVNGTLLGFPDAMKVLYINGRDTELDKFIELPQKLETFMYYDIEYHKKNKHIIKWLFKNKKMPTGLQKCVFPVHYADIYIELKNYAKEFTTHEIDWKFIDFKNLISHIKDKYK